jgi:pimeloyl-[acyl-carrier protein] methyl ester esterase
VPWFANRHGHQLWYEDQGSGKPLVLVHGWCMAAAVWQYQCAGLTSFRLIAPDLRGHGRSQGATGGFTLEEFSNDLVDLFCHLKLDNAVIAGWSMGGQIVLGATVPLAARLAGVVLIATTPCFTAAPEFSHGLSVAESQGMHVKVRRNLRRALEGFHTRLFAEGELAAVPHAAEISALLARLPLPAEDAAVQALEALIGSDLRSLLTMVETPVLIMNGDRDRICLPEASRYLAEHLAGAEQVVFRNCGHVPFLTQPALFNSELTRFIRRLSE